MEYDVEVIEDILKNLKKDPLRVIYTENYLNQIERRNIPEMCIEELVEMGKLAEIAEVENHEERFGLHFDLDSEELIVIVQPFNVCEIILISASYKNNGINHQSSHKLEFEGIYDLAFDLMDFHSKSEFEFRQTVEMESGLNVDFDLDGRPVAIELMMASKRLKLNRKTFPAAAFGGQIEITPESIKISLKAFFNNANIEARIFEREVPNEYGIPANVFDLILRKA